MKEYRLLAWPELPAGFRRTAHRRVLSDLSLRFMTMPQLAGVSGLRKGELRDLLNLLEARGVLDERDNAAPDAAPESVSPLDRWRRAFASGQQRR